MKQKISLSIISMFLIANSPSFSQIIKGNDNDNNNKPDFTYTRGPSLASTSHFRIELDVLHGGYQGRHLSLGLGGRFLAQHFYDNFSAEVSYIHRYRAFIPEENQIGFSQNQNLDPFRGKEFNLTFSYSFSKTDVEKEEQVTLRTRGNTSEVSVLPVRIHKMRDLRLGLVLFDLPAQAEFEGNYGRPSVHALQKTTAISIGYASKKMQYDTYKTDKYGLIKQSSYSEFFIDLLIAPKAYFPEQIYRANYSENNQWEPFSYSLASEAVYTDVRNSMKFLPVGGQLGWRIAGMNRGFGSLILFGLRPGFISQSTIGILDNCTASVTFSYHIPVKVSR